MGFYDDAGLDVTIKEYEFGMDVTADVVSQRADFGVGRSSLILESMEATDLQVAAVEMEKLVKGDQKETPSNNQLDQKFMELEKAVNQALEAAQTLGLPAEEKLTEPAAEWSADVPVEQLKEIADRIKAAADMGDVVQIQSIANELKSVNDASAPFCDKIIQLAEDFDFDGIQKLVLESGS